jgi:uncharacterized protein
MSELIDNRTRRIQTLKEIIQHLHAGQDPEQVKKQLREIVQRADHTEIMAMEQQLIAEGMPVEEVRSMCDLHSQVTREVLVQISAPRELAPGHPVDTFQRENEALRAAIGAMRTALAEAQPSHGKEDGTAVLLRVRQAFNNLMDIDKHYQRKEHALFSCLEHHGLTGPSKVMWAKDDDVRSLLKQLGQALDQDRSLERIGDGTVVAAERAMAAIEEMIYKEEKILLPMSLDTLTEEEWAEVWRSSPKYGWCLVEPRIGYAPPEPVNPRPLDLPKSGVIMLPAGNVTLEQLAAIFSTLPFDLTFVDASDRVAFFTEGPERIFARSRVVLGRKVLHCHPPGSMEIVSDILEDFRSGRKNVAEFWINFHGKFVHIRYFAVRDAQGDYLGTLELTQDIAPLQKLEGERRLLEYA